MKRKITGRQHYQSKVISKFSDGGFADTDFAYTGVEVNRSGKSDNENPMGVNRSGKSDNRNPMGVNRAGKDDQPQRVNRMSKDDQPQRVNRSGKDDQPQRVNRGEKVDLPNSAPPKPRKRPEIAAPKRVAPKPTPKPVRPKDTSFQDAVRRNETDKYIREKMRPKKSLFGKKLFGKG
jgi:hypothetical protein